MLQLSFSLKYLLAKILDNVPSHSQIQDYKYNGCSINFQMKIHILKCAANPNIDYLRSMVVKSIADKHFGNTM